MLEQSFSGPVQLAESSSHVGFSSYREGVSLVCGCRGSTGSARTGGTLHGTACLPAGPMR